MPAYQTSLQSSSVIQTVSDNQYAALRAKLDRKSALARPVTYTTFPHVAGCEDTVGGGESKPQRGRSMDPCHPAKQYLLYNVPSVTANAVVVQSSQRSDSTAEASLPKYRPGFRDTFAQSLGFFSPTMPLTCSSSSCSEGTGPFQGRYV